MRGSAFGHHSREHRAWLISEWRATGVDRVDGESQPVSLSAKSGDSVSLKWGSDGSEGTLAQWVVKSSVDQRI